MKNHIGEDEVDRSISDRKALRLSKTTLQPFDARELLLQDLD